MNVIIFGAGRRGLRLARHLIEEKKNVTFLDTNITRCNAATSKLDCMAICGSATDLDMLKEAGCENADAVIAVTDSDEVNLVSCGIVASQFPEVQTTIAAIRGITYLEKDHNTPILGISHIVNPDQEAASRIYGIIKSGLYRDIISFPETHFTLFTTTITKGSRLANNSLIDLKKKLPGQYVITGIRRKNRVFTPSGETILHENDEVAIISDEDDLMGIFKEVSGPVSTCHLRKIVIVGATRIAHYLISSFSPERQRLITLIDPDPDICNDFVEMFPKILVINGSVTGETLWEDGKISDANLVVSVTENDELNIITSLYAKTLGAQRVISLVKTNNNYIQLSRHLNIDAAISTTNATVDTLVKFIRGGKIETLHSLFDGDLEVYEFVIHDNFTYIGKALKDIDLRGKAIIAGVKRGEDENFIPGGSYTLTKGDTIIVAAAHKDQNFIQEFFS